MSIGKEILTERCYRSINILSESVGKFLCGIGITDYWVADNQLTYNEETENIDIVLFGSFLRRFLESDAWKFKSTRLWVISKCSAVVLSKLLMIPEKYIGIIPRYTLFPASLNPTPFLGWSVETTLVYAGRISLVKQIELLLFTYLNLEMSGANVRLVFCGGFDDEYPGEQGLIQQIDFKKKIENIVAVNKWKNPPIFLGQLGEYEWCKYNFVNPVFISLSTYIYEDFGVSVSQAQAEGMPCILSGWGGHMDIVGPNVFRIPDYLIGESIQNTLSIQARAEIIAKYLIEDIDQFRCGDSDTSKILIPERYDMKSILNMRENLIEKWSNDILYIAQGKVCDYANTILGREFFGKYKKYFSGNKSDYQTLMVTNSPNMVDSIMIELVPAITGYWIRKKKSKISFIYFQELLNKQNFALLQQAEHIIFAFMFTKSLPLVDLVRNKLSLSSRLTFYCHELFNVEDLPAVRNLLRTNDEIVYIDKNFFSEIS